ncbi:hypothetical protein [Streptomyces sp. NPDC050564]
MSETRVLAIAAAVGLDSADDARRVFAAARQEAETAIERRLGRRS